MDTLDEYEFRDGTTVPVSTIVGHEAGHVMHCLIHKVPVVKWSTDPQQIPPESLKKDYDVVGVVCTEPSSVDAQTTALESLLDDMLLKASGYAFCPSSLNICDIDKKDLDALMLTQLVRLFYLSTFC